MKQVCIVSLSVVVVGLLIVGVAWWFWPQTTDAQVAKVQQMQRQIFQDRTSLTESQRREMFTRLRGEMDQLTEQQREQVRREMFTGFRERMAAEVKKFHTLPPGSASPIWMNESTRWKRGVDRAAWDPVDQGESVEPNESVGQRVETTQRRRVRADDLAEDREARGIYPTSSENSAAVSGSTTRRPGTERNSWHSSKRSSNVARNEGCPIWGLPAGDLGVKRAIVSAGSSEKLLLTRVTSWHTTPSFPVVATSGGSKKWTYSCRRIGVVFSSNWPSVRRVFYTPGLFAEQLLLTPSQTEGPFYPDKLPLDTDNDLLVINDGITPAVGQVTYLSGRVLNAQGEPLRNAVVEIWQADNHGAYIHSQSFNREKLDSNFQGFGRFLTGSTGEYLFRTIKPVPYVGRTPHIHFAINVRGKRILTTQLYMQGEPLNAKDGIYQRIGNATAQAAVTKEFAPLKGAKANELAVSFDIVLGETPEDPS